MEFNTDTQEKYPLFSWNAKQPSRMNPDEKPALIEALRSGRYKQIEGRLKGRGSIDGNLTDVGFCCLGVATDLQVLRGRGRWDNNIYYDSDSFLDAKFVLSSKLTKILQINQVGTFASWTEFNEKGEANKITFGLSYLNDNGFTFNQIADVIDYFL